MSDEQPVELVAELRALGKPLRAEPAADEIGPAVMDRVVREPIPTRARTWRRTRRGWRLAAATIVGLLVGLLLVPPIRAEVLDWFGFAGVIVRESPDSAPSTAPPPPPAYGDLNLAQARRLVDFEAAVPRALGVPERVEVSDDRRILSMSWDTPTGVVRLDAFDGSMDPVFMKQVYEDATPATVRDADALWFAQPHEVVVLAGGGETYAAPPRLAGTTLIWQRGGTTLRLEGDFSLDEALEVARSAPAR